MATATRKKTRRTTKKKASAKAPNPAFAFLMSFMKRRPKAAYADAAAAAKAAGHTIYPIMWGRAQLLLGRTKLKKKGAAKKATARRSTNGRRKAGPKKRLGRPPGSRNAPKAAGEFSIPVADDDIQNMSNLVEALNAGGRAVLRFDGDTWMLAVE